MLRPLVVVLMNGSALAVPLAKEHAAALVEAWYPGEEGGATIAETLQPAQLSEVDQDGKTAMQPGDYSVFLGGDNLARRPESRASLPSATANDRF